MTITLQVQEVLRDPTLFVSNWRLAVDGVLLVTGDEFRIFQSENDGFDERVSLRIDDSIAAKMVQAALPQPPSGGWCYFGRAMVEAWTRLDPDGWVLHEVVSVWLEELGGDRPVSIKVRPHPWGWDKFL